MVRTIDVFVKNTEVLVKTFWTYESVRPECPRSHRGYLFGFPIIAPIYESILPETHQQAIEVAKKVANEKGVELKVLMLAFFVESFNGTSTGAVWWWLKPSFFETSTILSAFNP